MKKIYKFEGDVKKYDVLFYSECQKMSVKDSQFSKEEIREFLEKYYREDVEDFLEDKARVSFDYIEHQMIEFKNISLKKFMSFTTFYLDGKKSKMTDIMALNGFLSNTLVLSKKAKEYIQKRYGNKNIEFLEFVYKKVPLYILNVLEQEFCSDCEFPKLEDGITPSLDISKMKEEEIFRARDIKDPAFSELGIFCTEEFKKYIEASDLTGYMFYEVMDVQEAMKLQSAEKGEEESPIEYPTEEYKEYFPNGKVRCEGWVWQGYRVKDWKYYYENGTLFMEGKYSQAGEATGEWRYYFPNEKLKTIGFYEKGKKTGIFRNYDPEKGYLRSEIYYEKKEKGEVVSWKFYDEKGKLEKEGTAREIGNNEDWEIIGEWKYYRKDGELEKIETYENGEIVKVEEF